MTTRRSWRRSCAETSNRRASAAPAELAAWTLLTSTIFNLDITKNRQ